jgi:hypothetical protein
MYSIGFCNSNAGDHATEFKRSATRYTDMYKYECNDNSIFEHSRCDLRMERQQYGQFKDGDNTRHIYRDRYRPVKQLYDIIIDNSFSKYNSTQSEYSATGYSYMYEYISDTECIVEYGRCDICMGRRRHR